jgi:hypothetical protein
MLHIVKPLPVQHDPSCDGRGVFTNRLNCDRCAALVKKLNDRIDAHVRVVA